MAEALSPMHFVCTHEEAAELIEERDRFWVSTCGCRERKASCSRSRMDVCLMFGSDIASSGSGKREIDAAGAREVLLEAHTKSLVARPFRNAERTGVDGVCFCCDDCCAYFLDRSEICDKGAFLEETEVDLCSQCEACVDVCHFGARTMRDGVLSLDRDGCYGCGLCVQVCPTACISMVSRR